MRSVNTDILVIGTGIAGLSYAYKSASHFPGKNILVVTKGEPEESNTRHAQGGVAAVLDRIEDSFEQHIADTLTAGDGLCDREVVEFVVREGPDRIRELFELGAAFDRMESGEPALGREGGHSTRRIVHAGDQTGFEIQRVLMQAVDHCSNIRVLRNHFATDLICDKQGMCTGALLLDPVNEPLAVHATLTVIATGGIGQVYEVTTNPTIATGDGIAMAARAGAQLQDMAFVQFHPTALYEPTQNPPFLISEAVRGFGAELRNEGGEAFMQRYDPRGSLATRDIVARAIFFEMQRSGNKSVYLDARHLDIGDFAKQFPVIYQKCRSTGLDLQKDMIPVVPAAHYLCGGVKTDHYGCTGIPNLLCIGESACTGLHGANRLASNSLLEALVFAHRAFEYTRGHEFSAAKRHRPASLPAGEPLPADELHRLRHQLRVLMTQSAGIVRSHTRLQTALLRIGHIESRLGNTRHRSQLELRNMCAVARAIVEDSLARTENRGGFWLGAGDGAPVSAPVELPGP